MKTKSKPKAPQTEKKESTGSVKTDGYVRTLKLAKLHPEWIPIVSDCVLLSEQQATGKFAGAWVFNRARARGGFLPPNLRLLSAFGIIRKVAAARAGKRAYYVIRDKENVMRALKKLNHTLPTS